MPARIPARLIASWNREIPVRQSPADQIAAFIKHCKGSRKAVQAATTAEVARLRGIYAPHTLPSRLTAYRKALRAIQPDHPALPFLQLTDEEIAFLKADARKRVTAKQRALRPVADPKGLLKTAYALASAAPVVASGRRIGSLRWAEVAAGLLLLTGRRPIELIQYGEFRAIAGNPYMLRFRGQAKTRGAEGTRSGWYNIPILAPASVVLAGIRRIRAGMPKSARLTTYAAVHSHLSSHLSGVVKEVFGAEWGPYDFRAVYALICYHTFAPANIAQIAYYADILGHRLLEPEAVAGHKKDAAIADTITAAFYLSFYLPGQMKRLKLPKA